MSEQTLRRKLFLAGQEAEAVAKNGHSDADGGFDFTRFNDVLAEASRVLDAQGIVIIPEVDDVQLRFARSGDGALATVSMTFEVCDSETEETITKKWSGTGWDDKPGDKALYTAITGSEKYFLAKLLNIPFGIDPEEDAPSDELSAEARRIAAEQDRAAEQPDLATGQESDQRQVSTESTPPGDSGTAAQPVADPAPAASIEDEIPADRSGP